MSRRIIPGDDPLEPWEQTAEEMEREGLRPERPPDSVTPSGVIYVHGVPIATGPIRIWFTFKKEDA